MVNKERGRRCCCCRCCCFSLWLWVGLTRLLSCVRCVASRCRYQTQRKSNFLQCRYCWGWAHHRHCCNPTLRELWGRHSHSRKWDLGVLRDSQKFRAQLQGSKHLAWTRYLYRWKGLEVQMSKMASHEPIWTSAAQVMVEKRAKSQTGSLTPDH